MHYKHNGTPICLNVNHIVCYSPSTVAGTSTAMQLSNSAEWIFVKETSDIIEQMIANLTPNNFQI